MREARELGLSPPYFNTRVRNTSLVDPSPYCLEMDIQSRRRTQPLLSRAFSGRFRMIAPRGWRCRLRACALACALPRRTSRRGGHGPLRGLLLPPSLGSSARVYTS